MTPSADAPRSPDRATLADAVARIAASVAGVAHRRGAAAGVVWEPGVIATSASAVGRAGEVTLAMPDGESVAGRVRGVDPGTDLAAVSFDGASPPAVERSASVPRAGDFVFAVGREPSGLVQASFGHVGAAAGEWRSWRGGRVDRLVRLDGGLYPGFDGAPVADALGHCLGVASSAFSRHHAVVLPPATVDRVLGALLAHGRVPQGYLGIAAQPVRALLDGQGTDGLLVSSVADEGPAARAGLMVGDVIVRAAGQPVASIEELRRLIGAKPVGSRLQLQASRGGHAVDLTLEVSERPVRGCH